MGDQMRVFIESKRSSNVLELSPRTCRVNAGQLALSAACFKFYCLFLLLTSVRYNFRAANLNSMFAPDLTRAMNFFCRSSHSLSYHPFEGKVVFGFEGFMLKQVVATSRIVF